MAEIEISDSIKVSGFTLIEVLVAIAIFSIGFLALGSMHISATNNNLSAGMRLEGTTLAARQMEQLMIADYNDAQLTPGSHLRSDFTAPSGSYNFYTVLWNVAQDEALPGTKTINVTVCWQKNSNAPANCNPAPRRKMVNLGFIRADL